MTTAGDLIDGGAAGAAQRLAIGPANSVLESTGTAPNWITPPSPGSKAWQSLLETPAGALDETFPRLLAQNIITPSTTIPQMSALALAAGRVVTNRTFCTGNTGQTGGSAGWVALADSTGKILAVSANLTGATYWSPNSTLITTALGSPFTVVTAGIYYAVWCSTATGMPNLMGNSIASTQATSRTPALAQTSAAQSAPPAVNAVLSTQVNSSNSLYCYTS